MNRWQQRRIRIHVSFLLHNYNIIVTAKRVQQKKWRNLLLKIWKLVFRMFCHMEILPMQKTKNLDSARFMKFSFFLHFFPAGV